MDKTKLLSDAQKVVESMSQEQLVRLLIVANYLVSRSERLSKLSKNDVYLEALKAHGVDVEPKPSAHDPRERIAEALFNAFKDIK